MAFALISLSSSAQISVNNYRAMEQVNWNNYKSQVRNQLNQIKAQWTSGKDVMLDLNLLMNVEATTYTVVFNVRQVAKTALEVNTLINDRIDTLRNNLKKHGLKDDDIVVEIISQVPIYGLRTSKKIFSNSQNEVPIGFEIHKNVTVVFHNYNVLNDIVFEASKSEIYDMVKVDYFTVNPMQYFDTLRSIVTSYLKAVEGSYDEVGLELDSFDRMISEKTSTIYPIERYAKYTGLTRLSYDHLLDKNETLSAPIKTIVAPSMYYNHMPFDQFDIVLNTEIIKPSIQYTMNFKVRYTPKPKPVQTITKKEIEKRFFMVTDDGEIKRLDLD